MIEKIKALWIKDKVLVIALLLGIVSSLWQRPGIAAASSYIDWAVLGILLSLMLVVAGLRHIRLLDYIAIRLLQTCSTLRQVAIVLTAITYMAAMLVTNDVALLTFVPLALIIGKSARVDMGIIIIIQTLAANLGSMLTPPGNPQNLFLFAHYGYSAWSFVKVMLLPGILSIVYLALLLWFRSNQKLELQLEEVALPSKGELVIYLGLLILNIAAVLHGIDKLAALVVTLVVLGLHQRNLFVRVDYSLLFTFIGFFLFIGNISHTELVLAIKEGFLGTASGTYFVSVLASQFISNVPCAMLMAGMTNKADALLLGVNIGGMGTLIASMASLISYKLFVGQYPGRSLTYLKMFSFYNIIGLILIGGFTYWWCL